MTKWTISDKLTGRLNVTTRVADNLVRLLHTEDNTATFVARYRSSETGGMRPDEVWDFL